MGRPRPGGDGSLAEVPEEVRPTARSRWRLWVLVLVFSGIAAFLSPYLAPREAPLLERALIFVVVFGGALLLAYLLDRVLPRRLGS